MIKYILFVLILLSFAGCQQYDYALPVESYKMTGYEQTEDFVKIGYESSEHGVATITLYFTSDAQKMLMDKVSDAVEEQKRNLDVPLNLQIRDVNGYLFSLNETSESWFSQDMFITIEGESYYAKMEVANAYTLQYPSAIDLRMLEKQTALYSNPVGIEYFSNSEDLNGSIQLRNNQPTPIESLELFSADYNGDLVSIKSEKITLGAGEMKEYDLELNSGCTENVYLSQEIYMDYTIAGNTYSTGPFIVNTWCA